MTTGDIIVIAILAVVLGLAIRALYKKHKNGGGCNCGGNCSDCCSCSTPSVKKNDKDAK